MRGIKAAGSRASPGRPRARRFAAGGTSQNERTRTCTIKCQFPPFGSPRLGPAMRGGGATWAAAKFCAAGHEAPFGCLAQGATIHHGAAIALQGWRAVDRGGDSPYTPAISARGNLSLRPKSELKWSRSGPFAPILWKPAASTGKGPSDCGFCAVHGRMFRAETERLTRGCPQTHVLRRERDAICQRSNS